jgi:hypothetical protein
MTRRLVLIALLTLSIGTALAAKNRIWQLGTWREVHVTRPKVVFGLQQGSGGRAPGITTPAEVRTYVIETGDLHLEIRDFSPSNVRLIDAMVGEPVSFALEKDTLYIKDENGHERAFHVTRKSEIKKH